jgi:hypothetical protein
MTAVDYTTERKFLDHEIAIWGYDEIEDILNRGYRVVLTNDGVTWGPATDGVTGEANDLTKASNYATLCHAVSSVSPVSGDSRSNGVKRI